MCTLGLPKDQQATRVAIETMRRVVHLFVAICLQPRQQAVLLVDANSRHGEQSRVLINDESEPVIMCYSVRRMRHRGTDAETVRRRDGRHHEQMPHVTVPVHIVSHVVLVPP